MTLQQRLSKSGQEVAMLQSLVEVGVEMSRPPSRGLQMRKEESWVGTIQSLVCGSSQGEENSSCLPSVPSCKPVSGESLLDFCVQALSVASRAVRIRWEHSIRSFKARPVQCEPEFSSTSLRPSERSSESS